MASEIRANKQTNRAGLGTVTYTDTGIIVSGIVTANSFEGDGSSLTGIDATALKDTGGNVKIQAQASGAIHSGISTFNEIKLDNNKKILLGTGSDFSIYSTGSGAIIHNDGSGQLTISSDNAINLQSKSGSEYYFRAYPNNRAELYYDFSTYNTPKLQTSATGVTVDGTVVATSFSGDGSSLSNLPAGAPVGGASTNTVFFENDKAVGVGYSITSGKNAMSAGPIAINAGIAVTVPSGSSWTIV